MATKQAPKGGGGEQKKAAATPTETKEKELPKEVKKEDKASPKVGGKDPPKESKEQNKKPVKDEKKGEQGGGQERGRGGRQDEQSRGRDRGRRSSKDQQEPKGNDKETREVCRNFLHNRCDRGSLCKYYHPRSSSRSRSTQDDDDRQKSPTLGSGGQIVCRDFIRNMCSRGTECRFYHPPSESSSKKRQGSWLTFCHDFRNGHCVRSDCRFFHITREDEESYRTTGEIPLHIVDQAVRKAMVLDAALTGTRPTCKEFLRGLCNMQNCRFRHLSQREYEDEVFHALQDEFENLLGPPDRQPASPQMGNIYAAIGRFQDQPSKYNTPPADFRDDMLLSEDRRAPLMPMSEYESEPKRPRYFSEEAMFHREEFRDGAEGPRKWDEHMEYDLERQDINPSDTYRMMQEIYNLRNDNIDLRRNAEVKIAELKEEVARALEENTTLRHEVAKMRTTTEEDTIANKATLDKLTMTNNTLLENLHKAEEATRMLEHQNREKIKAMDNKQKSNIVELERKVDIMQKEIVQTRDALAKATAMQKTMENEKAKLAHEVEDLRAKIRSQSRKDSQQQQHGSNSSYNAKNNYSRDSMGSKDHRGDSSYSEMLYERRPPDSRDQDSRNASLRGQERYDPWSEVDNNSHSQYNSNNNNQGYSTRSTTETDRSRAWSSQDSWASYGSAKPAQTGSLMGEYRPPDDHMRGPPQNASLLRGPAYPSNTGNGLLDLPPDYGKASSRASENAPRSMGGQMGMEGKYSSQNMSHFQERDYSLSGYDSESRGQYGSHTQRPSSTWQQGGGGGAGAVDSGMGRGGINQAWRRGKTF